jgi:tRNA pseudouridine55 synthase
MGRRRKGSPIHGWVFLDKPLGLGSTQAVSMVRRAFNAQKAGHAGTLDPLATGLLAIALGEATKTVPYMMDADKTYTFTIKWGETTSTGDADERGEVIATSAVRPSRANIESVLPRFMGEIGQVPPAYSAIKVDGQRAYDLARAGQDVEIKSRNVRIESLRLVEWPDEDHATFEVSCSKGTYVRSLGQDIARALGAEGHLSMLWRTASGDIDVSSAITPDALEQVDEPARASLLHPLDAVLTHLPHVDLTPEQAGRVAHGNPVMLLARQLPPPAEEILLTCCSWNVGASEPVSGGAKAPACPVCYRSRAEAEGVATLDHASPGPPGTVPRRNPGVLHNVFASCRAAISVVRKMHVFPNQR